MIKETKIYQFEVTGGFDIVSELKKELSYDKRTIGFKLPDGRTVRPCIALEVESEDGCKYEYVTSEQKMAQLGFEGLDYGNLEFVEVEELH